jgi:2-dehydro-3-deoxygluconokinase
MTPHKIITFGEMMMRLSPPAFQRFEQANSLEIIFGGCESNVSVALATWDVPVAHITRFPANPLGNAAVQFLRQKGVDSSFIQLGGERLGLYFLENGVAMRSGRIVYDRYRSAFAEIEVGSFDWETIFENATWFHWSGITPALSANCAEECKRAISIARKKNLVISADIYYRSNLWKYGKKPSQIMPELVENCDLVLANEQNLNEIFGIPLEKTENPFVTSAQKMMEKFPQISKVVDTERVSISASHNQIRAQMWNGNDFVLTDYQEINPIVDRIGGGDAFMAGLIYGLTNYQSDQQALDFGICASALKHTITADVNLITVTEVENLMKGDNSGRLRR